MLRAVPGCNHRARIVDRAENFDERLPLDPLPNRFKQEADIDIGPLPDPVLVGKVPVGHHTCVLQLGKGDVGTSVN